MNPNWEPLSRDEVELIYPGALKAFTDLHQHWVFNDFNGPEDLAVFAVDSQYERLFVEVADYFIKKHMQLYGWWTGDHWHIAYGFKRAVKNEYPPNK